MPDDERSTTPESKKKKRKKPPSATSQTISFSYRTPKTGELNLTQSIKECLNESTLTDVTLISEGGRRRIEAHQCILRVSPVLERLFQFNEFKFSDSVTVIFDPDYSHASIKKLIQFLYTGQVELPKSSKTCEDFVELIEQLRISVETTKFTEISSSDSRKASLLCEHCGKSFDMLSKIEFHKRRFHSNEQNGKQSSKNESSGMIPERKEGAKENDKVENDPHPGAENEAEPELPNLDTAVEDEAEPELPNLDTGVENEAEPELQNINPDLPKESNGEALNEFKMPESFDIPEEEFKNFQEQTKQTSGFYSCPSQESLSPHSPDPVSNLGSCSPKPKSIPTSPPSYASIPLPSTSEAKNQASKSNKSKSLNRNLEEDEIFQKLQQLESDGSSRGKQIQTSTPIQKQNSGKGSLMNDLFGLDDDVETNDGNEESSKKQSTSVKSDTKSKSEGISSILKTSTPSQKSKGSHDKIQSELEEKRKRMMRALKSESKKDEVFVSKGKKSAEKSKKRRRKRKRLDHSHKNHICSSSCPVRHTLPEDENWIVHDSEEDARWFPDSDTSSSDGDDESDFSDELLPEEIDGLSNERIMKRKEMSRKSSDELDDEFESEECEDAPTRDRATRRQLRKGVDDLSPNGRNGKIVQVSVDNMGNDMIIELKHYRLKLLQDELSSSDSEDGVESRRRRRFSNESRGHYQRVKKRFAESSSEDEDKRSSSLSVNRFHGKSVNMDVNKNKSFMRKRSASRGRNDASTDDDAPNKRIRSSSLSHKKFREFRKQLSAKKSASSGTATEANDFTAAPHELQRSISESPSSVTSMKSSKDAPQLHRQTSQHSPEKKVSLNQASMMFNPLSFEGFKHQYGLSSEKKGVEESESGDTRDLSKISFKKKSISS